jgi:LacI family transcriptional regulator
MKVNLEDIARQLNVSTSTVSRSLRNDTMITPETRARVNEAARHMGYKRHKATSHALGLLLRARSLDAARKDENVMQMMAGIMSMTDIHRIHLHPHTIPHEEKRHMDEEASVIPPMIEEGLCQALIVHGDHDKRDIAFLAKRVPVISMGRFYRSLPVDAAVADNTEGVSGLVAHLVALGHRRLAWVASDYRASFMQARRTGFLQGCFEHKLDLSQQHFFGPEIFYGNEIQDKDALLAAVKAGATGLVCGNDVIAFKVIEVLEAAGQRIPDEVSVTGFDLGLRAMRPWRITSVDPHFFEIGKAAARLAIQRIAEPVTEPCVVSVRCEVVVGDTTAPAMR